MSDVDDIPLYIPVVAESVTIDKVAAVTDAVRVRTSVETHDVVAEDTITRGTLRIERVAVERAVDAAPQPRQEGDTTILSIVEERLVTEKRLFVVEEVRVTRDEIQERVAVPVTLRRTHVTIEHPSSEPTTGNIING